MQRILFQQKTKHRKGINADMRKMASREHTHKLNRRNKNEHRDGTTTVEEQGQEHHMHASMMQRQNERNDLNIHPKQHHKANKNESSLWQNLFI